MRSVDTVVIGAGQAGLAVSHELTARGVQHVVLERHEAGARWRRETWDSLRLLTPNWMNVLPGAGPTGQQPDGFVSAIAFADHLDRYAASFGAPIETGAGVEVLRRRAERFEVATAGGTWRATNVVVATGWCDQPVVPAYAADLDVDHVTPAAYRRPGDLARGGVLVVGASATGVQLAHELRLAGRDVTLAVGRHTRVPRTYRGMDIFWWLGRIGALDRTIDTMADVHDARHEPSLQLVGRPDRASLDLLALQTIGVRVVGRVLGGTGTRVAFDGDLAGRIADAECRLDETLQRIDDHIEDAGLVAEVLAPDRRPSVRPIDPVAELDLRAAGIGTVLWATGHRRHYPWLQIPVLDAWGEIRQHRGVTPFPGLYVLGQRFQHRRASNFIGGVGIDARFVAAHLANRIQTDCVPTAAITEEPSRVNR
jgi:putative flavoprotein involved in K+ transport